MNRMLMVLVLLTAVLGMTLAAADKKKTTKPKAETPLDIYVKEAAGRASEMAPTTPGAIWISGSRLADAARDVRASQVDDIITVVVAENASAVATGVTKTSRVSSTTNSIGALAPNGSNIPFHHGKLFAGIEKIPAPGSDNSDHRDRETLPDSAD